ncbi:MAG: Nre family DNA repair protein [Candidatus Methanomethylicia archaeon]
MPSRLSSNVCVRCKGVHRLCGRVKCPILERFRVHVELELKGSEVFGASPSVFIGEFGYPRVKAGPMIPPTVDVEYAKLHDDPQSWYGKSIEEIIELRSRLIRSNIVLNIKDVLSRNVETIQDIALSIRPVGSEAKFTKPIKPRLTFNGVTAPIGPTGMLESLRVMDNPNIPRKIYQIIGDSDVKTYNAVGELYMWGFTPYYIVRLLTVGLLGQSRERRLVPTRWGITAIDSMLGDYLLEKIREFKEIDEILLYSNSYLDNHYHILMLPDSYAFEMIEIWLPRTVWVKDGKPYIIENFELYDGKWRRESINGGYKTMRFTVIEHMYKIRRQAAVLALREVREGYYAPLGVWNVREGMRKAFENKPLKFRDVDEALKHISLNLKVQFREWYKEARIPKMFKFQRKILSFLG